MQFQIFAEIGELEMRPTNTHFFQLRHYDESRWIDWLINRFNGFIFSSTTNNDSTIFFLVCVYVPFVWSAFAGYNFDKLN